MLDYTCDLQRATSDPQSSDAGDLESDGNNSELAAQQDQPLTSDEPAAQQDDEHSTSSDEDMIVPDPAAQQGGEPSASTEDEDTLAVGEAADQKEYLLAMHCLKSLESAEFEVGYQYTMCG